MSEPSPDELDHAADCVSSSGGALVIPELLLRRRIDLKHIVSMQLSKLADDYLLIKCNPGSRPFTQGDKSMWMTDSTVKSCMETGKKFSFFQRRHHCRFSGNIYCNDAACYEVTLPDLGERAKRASLDEDENTRDEVREMATDIMATSTAMLTHPIRLARLAHFTRFARPSLKRLVHACADFRTEHWPAFYRAGGRRAAC